MVETGTWLATLIGALAKMAEDVARLSSTEIGEVAEPHAPGRGGSSALPHKRNPVSATVILAAHGAAKGHVVTLLDRWPPSTSARPGCGMPNGTLCRNSSASPPARLREARTSPAA